MAERFSFGTKIISSPSNCASSFPRTKYAASGMALSGMSPHCIQRVRHGMVPNPLTSAAQFSMLRRSFRSRSPRLRNSRLRWSKACGSRGAFRSGCVSGPDFSRLMAPRTQPLCRSDAQRGTIPAGGTPLKPTARLSPRKKAASRWCGESVVPGGSLFFGDPIFPITLAKLPRTSGLANDANRSSAPFDQLLPTKTVGDGRAKTLL
jgi:hypothetical protein